MKLSVWASSRVSYKGAWRMWKLGQLSMPVEQLPTGTVMVHPSASVTKGGAVSYARVSSADQKAHLDRQIARLSEFAASRHLTVTDIVKEIGSGLNGHRRAMLKILRNPASRTVTGS
ncbi:MAG: recombinase family protein [Thermodesulfovibrionales bacterium]|jgi:predicted site-specific integrase-resolvase